MLPPPWLNLANGINFMSYCEVRRWHLMLFHVMALALRHGSSFMLHWDLCTCITIHVLVLGLVYLHRYLWLPWNLWFPRVLCTLPRALWLPWAVWDMHWVLWQDHAHSIGCHMCHIISHFEGSTCSLGPFDRGSCIWGPHVPTLHSFDIFWGGCWMI
jgi:hypothetical protein